MTVLVLAEHDNTAIKSATLNTVNAATRLDKQVVVLVAGHQCAGAAESAAKIEGSAKSSWRRQPISPTWLLRIWPIWW